MSVILRLAFALSLATGTLVGESHASSFLAKLSQKANNIANKVKSGVGKAVAKTQQVAVKAGDVAKDVAEGYQKGAAIAAKTAEEMTQNFKKNATAISEGIATVGSALQSFGTGDWGGLLSLGREALANVPQETIDMVESIFPPIEQIQNSRFIDLSLPPQTMQNMQDNPEAIDDNALIYIAYVKLKELSTANIEQITLKLANNNITAYGVTELLKALTYNPKLVAILDFSGNSIGDEGVQVIADHLPRLAILHTIILTNCGISGLAAEHLISNIANTPNSMFQYLDLSSNPDITPMDVNNILSNVDLSDANSAFNDGINFTGISKQQINPQFITEKVIINAKTGSRFGMSNYNNGGIQRTQYSYNY